MQQEFTLSRGKVMMNFTLKYCDTRQKMLNSYGFKKVIESFVSQKLKTEEIIIYNYYIETFKTDEKLTYYLIEFFKLLNVYDKDEVVRVNNIYTVFLNDRDLFIELIELLYNYWRRLERITIVRNTQLGDGLQNVRDRKSVV